MMVRHLDARGLICPLPVLKARKVLLAMQDGEILCVMATDKNAPEDFALFCRENGYSLESIFEKEGGFEITLKVCAGRASK